MDMQAGRAPASEMRSCATLAGAVPRAKLYNCGPTAQTVTEQVNARVSSAALHVGREKKKVVDLQAYLRSELYEMNRGRRTRARVNAYSTGKHLTCWSIVVNLAIKKTVRTTETMLVGSEVTESSMCGARTTYVARTAHGPECRYSKW